MASTRDQRIRRYARRKALVDDWKLSSGCTQCERPIEDAHLLEFDHLPEYDKLMDVSHALYQGWEVLVAEAAKCEIVCYWCHKERTKVRRLEAKVRKLQLEVRELTRKGQK